MPTTRNGLPKRAWWQLASARIAIGFVIWSTLWIVISDFVLHGLLGRLSREIWVLETSKGLIYVLITAALLPARLQIDGIWPAILGGIVMSIISLVLERVLGVNDDNNGRNNNVIIVDKR